MPGLAVANVADRDRFPSKPLACRTWRKPRSVAVGPESFHWYQRGGDLQAMFFSAKICRRYLQHAGA